MTTPSLPLTPVPRPDEPLASLARRVVALRGIIFQCDAADWLGAIFIRPAEHLDQWWAGLHEPPPDEPGTRFPALAMHAGLHVVLDDGREFVLEQLANGWHELFVSGLHWTPLESFRTRDHRPRGGWDVTVPMTCFRQVNAEVEAAALARIPSIRGRPFVTEDCTAFLGRLFAGARLFADSPLLRSVGIALRSGEPALPLLDADAPLEAEAARRLRMDVLRSLPEPMAGSGGPSLRRVHHGLLVGVVASALFVFGLVVRALFWPVRSGGRRKRF